MRPIPFQQDKSYGCGSYALANLFNEKAFITDLEEGKGQSINDMNNLLRVYHLEFQLATCAQAHPALPIFNRFNDEAIFSINRSPELAEFINNHKRVWLCDVKKKRPHMVLLIQSLAEDVLYVVDSLEGHVYMTHINNFLRNNHVLGLHCLENSIYHSEGQMKDGEVLFFQNEQFMHLID